MKTESIRLFLQTFTDQRVANLQAACEDGRVTYYHACRCLVGFAGGNTLVGYEELIANSRLARDAEAEFCALVEDEQFSSYANRHKRDAERRQNMLLLIAAEWKRRRGLVEPSESSALVLATL